MAVLVMPPIAGFQGTSNSASSIIAQNNTFTWHHDCSNTSGFTRVDEWNTLTAVTYGELESDGDCLTFNNITDVEGAHGPVFVHEFNESFQLVALEEFSTRLYMYSFDGEDRGFIKVYLMDEMFSPVLLTYAFDNDKSSSGDINYERGNMFFPLNQFPRDDYIKSYHSGGSVTVDETYTFVMGDNELLSTISGHGIESLYTNLDLDNGRSIKYLVIEYGEYDIEDYPFHDYDWEYRIYDILVRYNNHAVEPDEKLVQYYQIPQGYLWFGKELFPDREISSQMLTEAETNIYYAIITVGTWRVTTTHPDWLDVLIDVTIDGVKTASGNSSGDFPTIDFVVTETTYVLIDVKENSAGGDSFGFYDIILTQLSTLTNTETSNTGMGIDLYSMAVILSVSFLIIIGAVIFSKRRRVHVREPETFSIPIHAIPRQYQRAPEIKGTIRTIRLPVTCPNCDAAVIEEEIDWTGPLQARCSYCGYPIRAHLEIE